MQRVAIVVLALAFSAHRAAACSCSQYPLKYCADLPDQSRTGNAVFVGTVVEMFPKSEAHWRELEKPFRSPRPGDRTPGISAEARQRVDSNEEFRRINIESNRRTLLGVLGDILTAEERRHIETATELGRQEPPGIRYGSARVRFRITEAFAGVEGSEFELISGTGCCDCSAGFEEGRSYYVVAYKVSNSSRWSTNYCIGTARAEQRQREVAALRTLKAGRTPGASLAGQLVDLTAGVEARRDWSGVSVRLRSETRTYEARPQPDGWFFFDGVEPERYSMDVISPGWILRQLSAYRNYRGELLDLSGSGCRELSVRMQRQLAGVTGRLKPVAGEGLDADLYLDLTPADAVSYGSVRAAPVRADGSFEFVHVPPGKYLLAINSRVAPGIPRSPAKPLSRIAPYPQWFYPGVSERGQARVFVVDGVSVTTVPDWSLPPKLKETTVQIQVLGPNGAPAQAQVMGLASWPPQAFLLLGITGLEGRISFLAADGLTYRVFAVGPSGRSPEVEVGATTKEITLTLTTR